MVGGSDAVPDGGGHVSADAARVSFRDGFGRGGYTAVNSGDGQNFHACEG